MIEKLSTFVHTKKKFITFCVGNHLVFWIELLLTFLFVSFVGISSLIAYGIALVVGYVLLFSFHRSYTFKALDAQKRRLVYFTFSTFLFYLINWILYSVLVTFFGIYYILAILLAGGFTTLFSYKTNRYWVFKKQIN